MATSNADCPHCPTKATGCCATNRSAESSGMKWVLGLFAKKCRGLGPDGLFQLDPAVFPAPVVLEHRSTPVSFDRPVSDPVCSLTSAPPVPPPRRG